MQDEHLPCIGLIGGLAVGASCEYYKRLTSAFARQATQMRLVLVHAELETVVGFMGKQDGPGLARYFGWLIKQLAAASATLVGITSVASHMNFELTAQGSSVPLVSILRAVRDEITRRQLGRVVLFGSRFAMESGMYGELAGSTELIRLSESEIATVDKIYMGIARQGYGTPEQNGELSRLAKIFVERDQVDAIVLAGTDLSVVYGEQLSPDFPFLDSIDAHIAALIELYSAQSEGRRTV